MAISVTSSAGYDLVTASTSHNLGSISVPAGTLAVMSFTSGNNDNTINLTDGNGANWIKIGEQNSTYNQAKPTVATYYIANTSGSTIIANPTVTIAVSNRAAANHAILQGANLTSPIGTTYAIDIGPNGYPPASTGVTAFANSMWLACYGANGNAGFTLDASDTLILRTASNAGGPNAQKAMNVMVYDSTLTAASGTTLTTAGAWSGNTATAVLAFEVKEAVLPAVSTSTATNLADTSATGNGEVISDGGSPITERGFVVAASAAADPTVTTNAGKFIISGTNGTFTGNMTGLTALTDYKYRSYATNAIGTAYGTTVTFSTISSGSPAPSSSMNFIQFMAWSAITSLPETAASPAVMAMATL